MDTGNKLFIHIVDNLLEGEVICSYTDKESYDYLSDGISFDYVNKHLTKMGRLVKQTSDLSAFYSGYQDASDNSIKKILRRLMSEAINEIEPMVRLLKIYGSANPQRRQIMSGETILESVLLAAIEDASPLINDLNKLSRIPPFKNNFKEASKQLNFILRKLSDNGYLVLQSNRYIATGKWSLFIDILEFIAIHEQLDTDEEEPQQLRM